MSSFRFTSSSHSGHHILWNWTNNGQLTQTRACIKGLLIKRCKQWFPLLVLVFYFICLLLLATSTTTDCHHLNSISFQWDMKDLCGPLSFWSWHFESLADTSSLFSSDLYNWLLLHCFFKLIPVILSGYFHQVCFFQDYEVPAWSLRSWAFMCNEMKPELAPSKSYGELLYCSSVGSWG